jgi:hypothetical protein
MHIILESTCLKFAGARPRLALRAGNPSVIYLYSYKLISLCPMHGGKRDC